MTSPECHMSPRCPVVSATTATPGIQSRTVHLVGGTGANLPRPTTTDARSVVIGYPHLGERLVNAAAEPARVPTGAKPPHVFPTANALTSPDVAFAQVRSLLAA